MDTSETYIKMRLAAIPDLGMGIKPADDSLTWLQGSSIYTDEVANFYFFTHQDGKDFTCQLERQDQLQEMVGGLAKFGTFDGFVFGDNYIQLSGERWKPAIDYPTSMEQLWLAFVMKERYSKIWNGEEWIKS